MNRQRRARLSLFGVLLILSVSVLSACEDSKPTNPTPIAQPTVQIASTSTVGAQSTPLATSISGGGTPIPVGGTPASLYDAAIDAINAGNYDAAIEALTQVIAEVPDYGPAYYARGVAYAAKDNADASLDDLNQAASLMPEDPLPVLLAGIILHNTNRNDEALQVFDYAVQLSPSAPEGYYWRASVLIAQDYATDALDDLQMVVDLSPDSNMGKQAAAAIEQINRGGQITPIEPAPLPKPESDQPPAPPEEPAPVTPVPQQGSALADLGFRPEKDGFSFENWGFSPNRLDLTPNDVRRMFGDQVCASIQGQECILTPAGQAWMEQKNQAMQGGHCEGFAALSLLFYQGKQNPADFGAAETYSLQIDDNAALQREIAYYWTTQTVFPTRGQRTPKTPAEIVDTLAESFRGGKQTAETYAIEFWKRGYKDGHAVTPYAIDDLGGGKYAIRLYDNNHPGRERIMNIDRNANTWSYNAATNPNEPEGVYEGDAASETLMLTPTGVRQQKQECPFCKEGGGFRPAGLSALETEYNAIFLDGTAHLLITDKDGKRTGFVDGDNFVNEIPGVEFEPLVSGVYSPSAARSSNLYQDSQEPIYYVPTGIQFTLSVKSTDPKENTQSTVTMIGPGYVLSVQDIVLKPGESDDIDFSEDGTTVTYRTQYSDSPDIYLGTETAGADYAFLVKGVELGNGGTVKVFIAQGILGIDTIDNTEPATYGLAMYRIDDKGEQLFGHDGITLQPNDIAHLDYDEWGGEGTALPLKVDHNGDGTDDEIIELTDLR